MIYVEAPNHDDIPLKESIFLAGGITGIGDWQKIVRFSLTEYAIKVYNPRRTKFDINVKEDTSIQIEWEYKYLRECTQIMFWFPYSQVNICPIVLFELGSALQRKLDGGNQKLFIGRDLKYKRREDVEVQSKLAGFDGKIHDTLGDLVKDILEYNKSLKNA